MTNHQGTFLTRLDLKNDRVYAIDIEDNTARHLTMGLSDVQAKKASTLQDDIRLHDMCETEGLFETAKARPIDLRQANAMIDNIDYDVTQKGQEEVKVKANEINFSKEEEVKEAEPEPEMDF